MTKVWISPKQTSVTRLCGVAVWCRRGYVFHQANNCMSHHCIIPMKSFWTGWWTPGTVCKQRAKKVLLFAPYTFLLQKGCPRNARTFHASGCLGEKFKKGSHKIVLQLYANQSLMSGCFIIVLIKIWFARMMRNWRNSTLLNKNFQ